jgi:hypothetical protein
MCCGAGWASGIRPTGYPIGTRPAAPAPYDPAVLSLRSGVRPGAVWIGLFLSAVGVAAYVVLPLRTGQVGFDSAASVLYFDRIVAGRHLEAFVTATPKPLLTLLYGAVHAVVPDWRAISWLAIVAFGLAVVLAAHLALRLDGISAAAFAAAGFMGSGTLLADVALGYALVWALLGWLIAGLALTSVPRPRFGMAGLGLLVAGTARFESILLTLVAIAAVVGWWLMARSGRAPSMPRSAWLLSVGLVQLPIQWAHDWLLTGDPLFSLSVPVRGTRPDELIGPFERAIWIVHRYLDSGSLLFLGILGVTALVLAQKWPVVAGIAVLGPGIAAFLVFLEFRHIYVSSRYAGPIDLAILFSAAIGFATVVAPGVRSLLAELPRVRLSLRPDAALVPIGLLAGILFASPFTIFASDVVETARSNLTLHSNAIAAEMVIATAGNFPEGSGPALLVPALLRPQMAVDLDLPVSAVGGLSVDALDSSGAGLHPGEILYHDRRGDPADPAFAILETTVPATLGSIGIVPIASDPRRGWWVVRIERIG